MSIYVDNLKPCVPNKNWPYNRSCHLIADDVDELHEFAKNIKLKKSWFQNDEGRMPHYDLTANIRISAVRNGARQLSNKQMADKIKDFRKGQLHE